VGKIDGPVPQVGEQLYDTDAKVFDDIQAQPGQEAFLFVTSAPYSGAGVLTGLFTATRLLRKNFAVTIVLSEAAVLLAAATRGYPTVGQEAFPGHLLANRQLQALIAEGATVYADRFSLGALYGAREDDLIEGVQGCNPLDVVDAQLHCLQVGAFRLDI
jgi:uncharacterized repeat protein (TIGR04044 family)